MAQKTNIQWCDHTFNPWRGCTKVSPGCQHCYAETLSVRNPSVLGEWGPNGKRVVAAEAYWRQPNAWNRAAATAGVRRRVFCLSLGDIFEERPELAAARRRLGAIIQETTWLDWLLLTKRPQNWQQACSELWWRPDASYPLPANVWLGVSVEDQRRADERLPVLRSIPARVRFVSYEPALGPVDNGGRCPRCDRDATYAGVCLCNVASDAYAPDRGRLHWWIVGGESGTQARSFDVQWAKRIVAGCQISGVACFVKQLGRRPLEVISLLDKPLFDDWNPSYARALVLHDAKGGDPSEWPEALRVREFPIGWSDCGASVTPLTCS